MPLPVPCDQIWAAAHSAQSCADKCKTRLLTSELLPVGCETWANNSSSKGKAYIVFWMFISHCVGINLFIMSNINNWQRAGNANRFNLSIIHLFNNNVFIFNGIMDFQVGEKCAFSCWGFDWGLTFLRGRKRSGLTLRHLNTVLNSHDSIETY